MQFTHRSFYAYIILLVYHIGLPHITVISFISCSVFQAVFPFLKEAVTVITVVLRFLIG